MGAYRTSRNVEASIMDYIKEELASASLNNVNVEKVFARVYDLDLPTVCVYLDTTAHDPVELGSDSTVRTPVVIVDIFATSDGSRLDVKDVLVSALKKGCPYYEYEVNNGQVTSKVQNGRLRIAITADAPINLATDKDVLDVHDRYRHRLTLTTNTGKVEI